MFVIEKGEVYTVNRATEGSKKNGEHYALIKLIESENQPKNIERPSKSNSAVNIWYESYPENLKGVKDGALIRIKDFKAVKWIHEEYFRRDGSKDYRDVLELTGVEAELA